MFPCSTFAHALPWDAGAVQGWLAQPARPSTAHLCHNAADFGLMHAGWQWAQVLGSLLAAALLQMDGVSHLHGWQWLFILEGGLTVLFGVGLWVGILQICHIRINASPVDHTLPVYHMTQSDTLKGLHTCVSAQAFLAETPAKAWFLRPAEREWLHARQERATQTALDNARHGTSSNPWGAPKLSACSLRAWSGIACVKVHIRLMSGVGRLGCALRLRLANRACGRRH